MVVLSKYYRVIALRFFGNCIGEALIDRDVVFPIGGTENGAHMGDMAEWPQPFVGKPVIVANLFLFAKPDAPEGVIGMFGGGTGTRSCRSTISLSAVPLPWAIHIPEHARMTGSIAVTRPLAGRVTLMPSSPLMWI